MSQCHYNCGDSDVGERSLPEGTVIATVTREVPQDFSEVALRPGMPKQFGMPVKLKASKSLITAEVYTGNRIEIFDSNSVWSSTGTPEHLLDHQTANFHKIQNFMGPDISGMVDNLHLGRHPRCCLHPSIAL